MGLRSVVVSELMMGTPLSAAGLTVLSNGTCVFDVIEMLVSERKQEAEVRESFGVI